MEQSKKYELLNTDTIVLGDVTLYRIKALISFGAVKKGELGGVCRKREQSMPLWQCLGLRQR